MQQHAPAMGDVSRPQRARRHPGDRRPPEVQVKIKGQLALGSTALMIGEVEDLP